MELSEFGMSLFLDSLIEKLEEHDDNCDQSRGRDGEYLSKAVREMIKEIKKVNE